MRVAVVNTYDAKDIKYWSGIPYHISFMLEAVFGKQNVSYHAVPLKRNLLSYLKGFYYNRIKHQNYLSWADEVVLNANKEAFKVIQNADFELIITFEFYIIPNLANGKSKIILWTDATFQNLLNYYSYVSNLSPYTLNAGNLIQQKAFDRCDAMIFSSEWAANSAIQNYSADAKKISVIPFASNINLAPTQRQIDSVIEHRLTGKLKLLFLGVDWERKGGDMAVAVVKNLNAKGIDAVLYVVGTDVPAMHKNNKHIINIGFVNKNETNGEQQIIELLQECSFLILPTKADCTPVAFSEANSFGLPVISTKVGGIPSIITNNLNGAFYDPAVFVNEATTFIEANWASADIYKKLCMSSYNYYNNNSSWAITEEKFRLILKQLKFE